MAFFLMVAFLLPQMAGAITIREENEVAVEFIKMVRARNRIIDDPVINGYITGLGQKLLKFFPEQAFPYTFYVVESDVFNAFAGPGGHVFINSGLFEALPNEESLAGIMAHEISHVHSRHISDRIDRSKKIGVGTLAGVAAGILVGVSGNAAAGGALAVGSLAGSHSAALSFSREDEMQADQVGMTYLAEAGYGGDDMLTALKTIREKQWFGPAEIPTYLSTHPALEDRIAYIGNWLVANREKVDAKRKKIDQSAFLKTKARITALFSPIETAEEKLTNAAKRGEASLYTEYGLGLLMNRRGKYEAAAANMKSILAKRAFDFDAIKGLAQIYFNQGKSSQAHGLLTGVLSVNPIDFEANMLMGEVLIDKGHYEAALRHLSPLASDYGPGGRAHYLLGNIFSHLKRPFESSYHLGLYYRSVGDLRNALFQLERAETKASTVTAKREVEKAIESITGKKKKKKKETAERTSSSK
ncbi:MAG: M48 family metalloprotease [Desulfobacterales bacterium]|nr:M48 family metalloprotease [Desulfobacterales bacterium]